MIVTYNWLKEFVDFNATPADLCHRLTMAGLEVDSLKELGAGLESVVVARLDAVAPHPDADRLTLCQVNTGTEVVPVVCGATNHKTGDLVALAQPGTVLPGEFKIKKSKIRGQISHGMLCSEKELGLADESAGIMILPADLPIGQPVFDVMGWRDYQIEIGLTPNRPDCLSVIGVAREVAALYGRQLKLPTFELLEAQDRITAYAGVTIDNPDFCPRYAARMIRGVKIGPSPEWMVRRLEAVGMRSINNIVDVTNYVMMELGHPLHAFDFRFVEEGRIVVKCALDGDNFTTLDGKEYRLSAEDLMICDGRRPVALAGIMGGQNSEVQNDTETILLEAAYFNPTSVRRSSKRHGLHTESSHRFERGADVDMVPVALERAAELMARLGGGEVLSGIVDVYPQPLVPTVIDLHLAAVKKMLGLTLSTATVQACLESIGLAVSVRSDLEDCLKVSIPSFRPDLEREIDLIEEVARLHGYDKIPVTMPIGVVDAKLPPAPRRLQKKLRQLLVTAGFSETINYSFVGATAVEKIALAASDQRRIQVPVLNPLSEEQAVMRTSLVPSLLDTVVRNLNYRSIDLRLFELRPVFFPSVDAGETTERMSLAAVMTGRREPEGWAQISTQLDFFDLKGVVERILEAFGIENPVFDGAQSQPYLHPGKSCALVTATQQRIGCFGEVHPQVLSTYDIDQPVFLLDLDVDALLQSYGEQKAIKPLSRFPDVSRDSALLLDSEVSAAQVLEILHQNKSKMVEDLTLFDLYTGVGIPEGKKSLGVRIRYRDMLKTLTEEEVGKVHDRMIKALCQKLGAEIR